MTERRQFILFIETLGSVRTVTAAFDQCTKANSERPRAERASLALPMPDVLVERLRDYEWNPSKRENANGFLFLNHGRPYSANRLRERKLHPVLAKLGIEQTGCHAFRYAVASELLDAGVPITVVQTQMRHSGPRITLGIYGHIIPQSQRAAMESLVGSIGD